MGLDLETLRAVNLTRCRRWHTTHGVNEWSLSDWGIAAAGEMGEALNVVKKLNRERDGMVGNKPEEVPLLEMMLANEIADTIIYLDLLAARAGIDLSLAIINKYNATSLRNNFPERL